MTKLIRVYATRAEGDQFAVIGIDERGGEFTYEAFFSDYNAQRLVSRIEAAGKVINDRFWNYRAPYGTQAWLDDGEEDRLIEDEKAAG